jgi:hypothetical protein
MMPPMFKDAAVMVKLIQVPAVTVWFPGTVSVGGSSTCTLTILVTATVARGTAESITITLAV